MSAKNKQIVIPDNDGNYTFLSDEIIHIASKENSVEFHLSNEKFQISSSLKKIQEYLSPDYFVKINRSNIINLKHIKFVTENSNIKVYLSNDTEHIISDNMKSEFFEKFKKITRKPA